MTTGAAPADLAALTRDGIIAHRAAFDVAWVDRLHLDVLGAFEEARRRDGGAIGRGPQRWYVEVHPQQLSGFVDLVTHPWVDAISQAVLGPDYQIIEIGFDVPLPGAVDQPWHRDFPSPEQTHAGHRLTSLAFNISTVDTTPDMGPFQIAPGTQYEPGLDWQAQMFPPREEWPRFQAALTAADAATRRHLRTVRADAAPGNGEPQPARETRGRARGHRPRHRPP